MRKSFLLLIMLITITSQLFAQNDTKIIDYKAYLTNSIALWEKSIQQQNDIITKNGYNYFNYLNLGETYYGLMISCMGTNNSEKFKSIVKEAQDIVDLLLKSANDSARVYALQAGIYSITMGFNPGKGMFLGAKNQKCIDTALKKNYSEPRAWAQKGGSKFHTPEAFGGDVKEAITCFEKSIELFELQNDTSYNWYYLDVLAWLGQSYAKNSEPSKAKEIYDKAMKKEPGFNWVKYVLLPELNKQVK